jgi:hypothetical protein
MTTVLLWVLLSQAAVPASAPVKTLPDGRASVPGIRQTTEGQNNNLLKSIVDSGRVLSLVRSLDEKVLIAPGAPPLLTFRYLEGRQRGRFGGLDLVLDDAGH